MQAINKELEGSSLNPILYKIQAPSQMSNQESFAKHGKHLWETLEWTPSSEQINQMLIVQKSLVNWNRKLNLTRLTQGEDYWISQIFDSLWPLADELKTPHKELKCIDVGSGCGFPGLAVAIALPGSKLTLIDSTKKKTIALKAIAKEAGLSARVNVRTERAEVTGHLDSCRGKFDLAMARAVSTPPVVAEYLIPLIKTEGQALLYLGKWNNRDEKALSKSLIPLKAKLNIVARKELPSNRGERHQLRLKTIGTCPKNYPREIGVPVKKPLSS